MIAIENTRLLNELRQRTDDLTESLEQQTATSEVLKVISSSPGELEPVFQAMLANATRVCSATFGTMYLREADGFRTVAVHNSPAAYAEVRRREGLVRPPPRLAAWERRPDQEGGAHYRSSWLCGPTSTAIRSWSRRSISVAIALPFACRCSRTTSWSARSPSSRTEVALHRQADRAGAELRRPGGHRHREHAAAQRAAQRTEICESLQQQTATADVLKVISRSTFDLQTVLDTLVESAARLCEADMAAIVRLRGRRFSIAASYGYPPRARGATCNSIRSCAGPRDASPGESCWKARPFIFPMSSTDPEFTMADGARTGEHAHRCSACRCMREGDSDRRRSI